MSHPDDPILDVQHLSRRYGRLAALDGVSLRVRRGGVLGLVGVNGSGKTTLIKHLLGLLKAQAGTVRVFGLDPVADPVKVLSRIGYLSEDCELPNWMRVGEMLRYTGSFYPTWDHGYATELCRRFGLDPRMKIAALSRGLRARAGLVNALGHRPELLVLDEPSSGLDPLARRDILQAIVRTVASAGNTVLFSSHLLDEVERVADQVAILDSGKLLFAGDLDGVRGQHRRLTLRFSEPRETPPALQGVLSWEGGGREWTALCLGEIDTLYQAADRAGGEVVEATVPGLDDVLAAHAATSGRAER